jgi:hypothetical protein
MTLEQTGTPAAPAATGGQAVSQENQTGNTRRPSALESRAADLESLIKLFSRPASKISGGFVGLVGLLLVGATLGLGIAHLLVAADFTAAIISGTALSIAGVYALAVDDFSARRAAEREFVRSYADDVHRSMTQSPGSH